MQNLPEKYQQNAKLFGKDANLPTDGPNMNNPSGKIDPGVIDKLKANGVTRQNIADLAKAYAEEAKHVKSTSPQSAAMRADYLGRMLDSW